MACHCEYRIMCRAAWQASRNSHRFESDDDWFDYRLEDDPRFLQRIESARRSLHSGRGIALEDIDKTPIRRWSRLLKSAPA